MSNPLRAILLACFGAALCVIPALHGQSATLSNPVLDRPDPFITRVGGNYILLATTGHNITLWASPRMEDLSKSPKVVWTPKMDDALQKLLTQVWSPTLWQIGDHWWIYYTATTDGGNPGHGIFALRSTGNDPLGPYDFAGQVDTGMPAIDPSVLEFMGKQYLMFVSVTGKNQVWIAQLADGGHLAEKAKLLIAADQPWEKQGGEIVEGPTALYHEGHTFLVYSGSHTASPAYCLGLLTYSGKGEITDAANWEKTGPVLEQNPQQQVYGPGRGTFTTSPDGKENWILYAAKTMSNFTGAGRSTRAQRFTYGKDGAPIFAAPMALSAVQPAPSGEAGK